MKIGEKGTVDCYIMEMSPGQFLHMNATEDGNGTWVDFTPSIWEAYWSSYEHLVEIAENEFSDFPQDFPKFYHMKFTSECMAQAVYQK